MRSPARYGEAWTEAGWATQWREQRDQWELRLSQVAGFDPIKREAIKRECTLDEFARVYMDYLTCSMNAYDQVKPR